MNLAVTIILYRTDSKDNVAAGRSGDVASLWVHCRGISAFAGGGAMGIWTMIAGDYGVGNWERI